MNYVIKRDGRKVKFNKKRIEKAIEAAFTEVDGELTEYDYCNSDNIKVGDKVIVIVPGI